MVLVYILLLIPLTTTARRFDVPSYRSNVMEGGKPILRMGPEADDAESDNSDEYRQPSPHTHTSENKAPESVKNMNQVVNWLVEHFSYDLVAMGHMSNDGLQDKPEGLLSEPHNENENDEPNSGLREGDKPVSNDASKEIEESDSVSGPEDHDDDIVIQKLKVPNTESSVDPPVETPASKETGLRTLKKRHKEEEEGDPEWMVDLKDFIKDLTTQHEQHDVLDKMKPVIATLEKKHDMTIKDIDVDEYGEIHITYTEKGKNKKTARKRKDTDYI